MGRLDHFPVAMTGNNEHQERRWKRKPAKLTKLRL